MVHSQLKKIREASERLKMLSAKYDDANLNKELFEIRESLKSVIAENSENN
jgi:hypothetical protein